MSISSSGTDGLADVHGSARRESGMELRRSDVIVTLQLLGGGGAVEVVVARDDLGQIRITTRAEPSGAATPPEKHSLGLAHLEQQASFVPTPGMIVILVDREASLGAKPHGGCAAPVMGDVGSGSPRGQPLRVGPLWGEPESGDIFVGNDLLHLSATESNLLWVLLRSPHNIASKEKLTSTLRPHPNPNSTGRLRVFIHRLRQRLAEAGHPGLLISFRGGYRLFSGQSLTDLNASAISCDAKGVPLD
jgi:DNA-binding winged helix-turn-helix (wHTH) protein